MIKKCLICGTEFNSNRGQKYCSDGCRRCGKKVANMRSLAKQKVRQTTAIAFNSDSSIKLPSYEPVVSNQDYALQYFNNNSKSISSFVNSVSEPQTIEPHQVELDYVTRSINALKNLDNAINQVQEIIDMLKREQSIYYKEDNEFAHIVEGSGSLTDMQKVKLVNDYQLKRSKRRNVKDIIVTLINCIRYTPRNCERIIKDALQSKIKVDEFFRDYYKHRGV